MNSFSEFVGTELCSGAGSFFYCLTKRNFRTVMSNFVQFLFQFRGAYANEAIIVHEDLPTALATFVCVLGKSCLELSLFVFCFVFNLTAHLLFLTRLNLWESAITTLLMARARPSLDWFGALFCDSR